MGRLACWGHIIDTQAAKLHAEMPMHMVHYGRMLPVLHLKLSCPVLFYHIACPLRPLDPTNISSTCSCGWAPGRLFCPLCRD